MRRGELRADSEDFRALGFLGFLKGLWDSINFMLRGARIEIFDFEKASLKP